MSFAGAVKVLFLTTTLAVSYTHMQIQALDLAYQGKAKEKVLRELREENGLLNYEILSLKSANYLGGKILQDESDMQFASPDDVIEVSMLSRPSQIDQDLNEEVEEAPFSGLTSILGFFDLEAEAQADVNEF